MSLLVYNRSGSDVILAGTTITIPASTLPPLPGPPVNVSAELKDLTNEQWAAIEVQRAAAPLEFVWIGLPLYTITGLEVTDVYGDASIALTSSDGSIAIDDKDLVVAFSDSVPANVDAYTEDPGSLAESARADHVHKIGSSTLSSIYSAIYGALFSDASDGDFDLDGTNTTTWTTKVGFVYTTTRVAHCGSGYIRNLVELKTNNFHGPYGNGRLQVDAGGVISNDGAAAVGSVAGAQLAAGTFTATAAGATGTATGVGNTGSTSGGAWGVSTNRYSGGAGGTTGGNTGGNGGTVAAQNATRGAPHGAAAGLGFMNFSQVGTTVCSYGSGGGAGGGDGSNPGGGGGAGAGGMHLGWGSIVNNGTIRCNGGAGGDGTLGNASGGGGGGGGGCLVYTGYYEGNLPSVAGGPGGNRSGTGGFGNTGLAGQQRVVVPALA